jgi:hypothetical protein
MIGVRLGIDDETDRHRGEIADRRPDVAGFVRVLAGVDDDDALLGEDDAGVRLEAPSGVDVDAVGELFDLRTEIPLLRARSADANTRDEHTRGENRQPAGRLYPHDFLPFKSRDLSAPCRSLCVRRHATP